MHLVLKRTTSPSLHSVGQVVREFRHPSYDWAARAQLLPQSLCQQLIGRVRGEVAFSHHAIVQVRPLRQYILQVISAGLSVLCQERESKRLIPRPALLCGTGSCLVWASPAVAHRWHTRRLSSLHHPEHLTLCRVLEIASFTRPAPWSSPPSTRLGESIRCCRSSIAACE